LRECWLAHERLRVSEARSINIILWLELIFMVKVVPT
jgi:hypothetical protein